MKMWKDARLFKLSKPTKNEINKSQIIQTFDVKPPSIV